MEVWERPLATGLEQTFGLELAIQAFAVHLGQSDAFGEEEIGHQLAAALTFVQVDHPVGDQGQSVGGHDRRIEGAAAEQHAA